MERLAERAGRRWNGRVVAVVAVFPHSDPCQHHVYLVGALLGGGTSVNLANNGVAFEYFYTTTPDLASARWLGGMPAWTTRIRGPVRAAASSRSVTGIQNGLILDLTPMTINQHAWVYASPTNVVDGSAFAFTTSSLAAYAFRRDSSTTISTSFIPMAPRRCSTGDLCRHNQQGRGGLDDTLLL